jgi:hypothetical protein
VPPEVLHAVGCQPLLPIQLARRAAATTRGATTRGRISRQPPLPIRGDASRSSWGPMTADVSELAFRRGLAVELRERWDTGDAIQASETNCVVSTIYF